MIDCLGRKIEYLRISVTDNCNLNCIYCRTPGSKTCCSYLEPEDFGTVVRVMASLGIKKVRVTGGEPLMRPDITDIVRAVSSVDGIEDVSMTTNGIRLAGLSPELKAAGLKRVNISLDSLREERFSQITGGGKLKDVLTGLEAADKTGLDPIKINVVLVRGLNDDETADFIGLTRDFPVFVRFIELMPIGKFGEDNRDKVVFNKEILKKHPELVPAENMPSGEPARYFRMPGYKGLVGLISPMSHRFCGTCNRIRLTCDGKLKPCLGSNSEVDIFNVLKKAPDKLFDIVRDTIYKKPAGHHFDKGFSSSRTMNNIGG